MEPVGVREAATMTASMACRKVSEDVELDDEETYH